MIYILEKKSTAIQDGWVLTDQNKEVLAHIKDEKLANIVFLLLMGYMKKEVLDKLSVVHEIVMHDPDIEAGKKLVEELIKKKKGDSIE